MNFAHFFPNCIPLSCSACLWKMHPWIFISVKVFFLLLIPLSSFHGFCDEFYSLYISDNLLSKFKEQDHWPFYCQSMPWLHSSALLPLRIYLSLYEKWPFLLFPSGIFLFFWNQSTAYKQLKDLLLKLYGQDFPQHRWTRNQSVVNGDGYFWRGSFWIGVVFSLVLHSGILASWTWS